MRHDKRVVKYTTHIATDRTDMPGYVNTDDLIADNWQPWGQPWFSETLGRSLQVWVKYEDEPVETVTQNNY